MNITIRNATASDAEHILAIYAPYVTDTCISFENEVPSEMSFRARIENTLKNYPYLVCEADGKIVGYAYASKHRERAAYAYSVDVSIYIAPQYHNKGIGKRLYTELFSLLSAQNYYTAFAGITVPNESSIELHKSFGFTEVGVYHNVGYKQGKWHDVIWLEKQLKDYDIIPDKPL